MNKIMKVAKKYDLEVIEDVAQAMGGSFDGKPLDSFGDCGCFSLQYHKILTSGEGGIVVTNDMSYSQLAWQPKEYSYHQKLANRVS